MVVDADEVRDRAWVERRDPGEVGLDEAMWTAEDPVTDCSGAGRVEAEAVGNLIAAVAEFDRRGDGEPLMKMPGRIVARPNPPGGGSSLLDDVRSLF